MTAFWAEVNIEIVVIGVVKFQFGIIVRAVKYNYLLLLAIIGIKWLSQAFIK